MRLALLFVALMSAPAQADWSRFYSPSPSATAPAIAPQPTARAVPAAGVCIREILTAQLRHAIPGNLLLAIGLQEAGLMHEGELTVWPWAANANGDGRYFDQPGTAQSWVRVQQSSGTSSIDVGCMQINLRWHPEAFATIEQGFDPAANVDYAARRLAELYAETGDWTEAAGRYHSATETLKTAYLDRLRSNVAIANKRLDVFRELAARGGATRRVAAAPSAAPLPAGHFWTSDLTRRTKGTADGARSLFGREPMQPVLPSFEKMF
ncbi:lytic transglycosylase domain-containing protein [Marinovum sp. KMM 9879]